MNSFPKIGILQLKDSLGNFFIINISNIHVIFIWSILNGVMEIKFGNLLSVNVKPAGPIILPDEYLLETCGEQRLLKIRKKIMGTRRLHLTVFY